MKYVLLENKRGYLEKRESESCSLLVEIEAEHTDKSPALGYIAVGGEKFYFNELGKTLVPSSFFSSPYTGVKIVSREKLYLCEGIVNENKKLMPGYSAVDDETVTLMIDAEKTKRKLSHIEARLEALEKISFGCDILK